MRAYLLLLAVSAFSAYADTDVEEIFAACDADQDGQLTFEESQSAACEAASGHAPASQDDFAKVDADGDNLVSLDEVYQYMSDEEDRFESEDNRQFLGGISIASWIYNYEYGDYDTKLTAKTREMLESFHYTNKNLVLDTDTAPTKEHIKWRQIKRCGLWECGEDYYLADYYEDGNKENAVTKVFVAKSEGNPPAQFNTSGYNHKLHCGLVRFGEKAHAFFFVIHPNSWGPYQKRFRTSKMSQDIETAFGWVEIGAGLSAGTAAGAAIGTAIFPGPGTAVGVVGGVVGGVLGTALGHAAKVSNDFLFGHYLRYIG